MEGYSKKSTFYLPGLFHYYNMYKEFFFLYETYPEYFYDNVEIGAVYDCPTAIWNGGRVQCGTAVTIPLPSQLIEIREEMKKHNVPVRFTFTNSQIKEHHLHDEYCNLLLETFKDADAEVIVCSDLLEDYIRTNYKDRFKIISSTTKCIMNPEKLDEELDKDYYLVVLDFRLNKKMDLLKNIKRKDKIELLVNEVCNFGCKHRKECYESISTYNLMGICSDGNSDYSGKKWCDPEHPLTMGYAFKTPMFISKEAINDTYLPMGYEHFKLNGRMYTPFSLIEVLTYYLVKEEHAIDVREKLMAKAW